MKLSEKIQICRRRAGLSQEALAEAVGVSRQAVSKWECGDAIPEPGKLLLLARTFGVTADWLLDDTAGETREQDAPAAQPSPVRPTWVDSLPGAIGRFVRRFGWLAGVYLLLIGLLFCGIGGLGRVMFGSVTDIMETTVGNFGDSGFFGETAEIIIRDEQGNPVDDLPDEVVEQIMGEIGTPSSPFPAMPNVGVQLAGISSITMIVPNLILALGIILVLGGGVLTILLLRVSRREKNP